jgi:hypothetical protein
MKKLLLAALLATCAGAQAADLGSINLLNQAQFRALSEDLSSVLSYKSLVPAEPLGITGFDLGLAVVGTDLQNVNLWQLAASGQDIPSLLPVPTLRLYKGLPFDIDIGVQYAAAPSTNVRMYGGELRWAVLAGSTLTPAIALRIAHTRLAGVDQLKADSTSADISISKGFAMFTPYAGIGVVRSNSAPQGIATLRKEKFDQSKVFAGLNVNFLLVNLALEADKTGDAASYGVKLGFRF